jgi:hypothetical protein
MSNSILTAPGLKLNTELILDKPEAYISIHRAIHKKENCK